MSRLKRMRASSINILKMADICKLVQQLNGCFYIEVCIDKPGLSTTYILDSDFMPINYPDLNSAYRSMYRYYKGPFDIVYLSDKPV
ncbi:MAG: hypothetical protein IBX47_09580 [Desulfuromonadales bacterium]|nr:hypothetical protein [Desulfuromonadales bacterium]